MIIVFSISRTKGSNKVHRQGGLRIKVRGKWTGDWCSGALVFFLVEGVIMEKLKELVMKGAATEAAKQVKELLDQGANPEAIMKEALISGMDEVGDLFQKGDYYIPEMLVAARAMQHCLEVLKPALTQSNIKPLGKVVIGTVRGDFHDIGKNIVIMVLEGVGFEVIDLGMDVSPQKFIDAIKKNSPVVVGFSALLTTTMLNMKEAILAIKEAGLREKVKIMIGGAPVSQKFADEIGADFYAPDATAGRNYVRNLISKKA
jgi:5-methyltetrahydrofolate--homocysteine methyltransferase